MAIDLFTSVVEKTRQHSIFQRLLDDMYAPERSVLNNWAEGFEDRDGKFVQEFQLTFESSFWELYLHAAIKSWGLKADMTFSSPDFVIASPPLSIEATIAAPAKGGKPAYGYGVSDIPEDLTTFNIEATLRICNSFDSKYQRYQSRYATLPQVAGKPYVIAIGAFDRPMAHLAASRPIIAAAYGLYHDEAATSPDAKKVVSYNVDAAPKSASASVPVGLFCDDKYADVSAIIYSSLATWGKLRALADNPAAHTVYQTYHPNSGGLLADMRITKKREYREDLLDGLYVLHNPFAKRPLPRGIFSHPRLAEISISPDGQIIMQAPDDFLLSRQLMSVIPK